MVSSIHSNDYLIQLEKQISNRREDLLSHSIYKKLQTLSSIRIFMKYHVFAVWDFMSLVKSLQRSLTCIDIPWKPSKNQHLCRFINEIVLTEESDEIENGVFLSHFELYLRAMDEVQADTNPIRSFVDPLIKTHTQDDLLKFMQTTFKILEGGPHEVASSFLFGREDLIPEMFLRILNELSLLDSEQLRYFKIYLKRHIQIDSEKHASLAQRMLITLCEDSEEKWNQAQTAALISINARMGLWDFIEKQLDT